jgi:hypothetical protein
MIFAAELQGPNTRHFTDRYVSDIIQPGKFASPFIKIIARPQVGPIQGFVTGLLLFILFYISVFARISN